MAIGCPARLQPLADLVATLSQDLVPGLTGAGVLISICWSLKNPLANAGDIRDLDSIHGSGRSPGEGNGNPLPYSCLENSMDRRTWGATVHKVTKSQTQLKWLSTHARKQVLTFLIIRPRILSNLQFYLTVTWHLTLVTTSVLKLIPSWFQITIVICWFSSWLSGGPSPSLLSEGPLTMDICWWPLSLSPNSNFIGPCSSGKLIAPQVPWVGPMIWVMSIGTFHTPGQGGRFISGPPSEPVRRQGSSGLVPGQRDTYFWGGCQPWDVSLGMKTMLAEAEQRAGRKIGPWRPGCILGPGQRFPLDFPVSGIDLIVWVDQPVTGTQKHPQQCLLLFHPVEAGALLCRVLSSVLFFSLPHLPWAPWFSFMTQIIVRLQLKYGLKTSISWAHHLQTQMLSAHGHVAVQVAALP